MFVKNDPEVKKKWHKFSWKQFSCDIPNEITELMIGDRTYCTGLILLKLQSRIWEYILLELWFANDSNIRDNPTSRVMQKVSHKHLS